MAPACWAKDPLFHGKVFEGDDAALRDMATAVSQLLLELPLPWVASKAVKVGSGSLVADEEWNDTWEADPSQAMTVNPKTGGFFHNPLYTDLPPRGDSR